MGYLFIILSAVCSLLIAHFLKTAEVKKLRTLNTLTVNYLIAGLLAAGTGLLKSGGVSISLTVILLVFCLITGTFFISNFAAYSKSVHANGMGITIAAMRLSVLVPVLISVYFYREFLNYTEIAGVMLVLVALVLLIPQKRTVKVGRINAGWLLLIIFILSGFADASLKIYQEEFRTDLNEALFMALVFLGAFIIGLTACIVTKGPVATKQEWKLGTLIGIPNLYSSIFLIFALNHITGSIAYPLVNMLSVIGGTALGLIRWNDTVSYSQWAGLGVAIIAIILLFTSAQDIFGI